MAQNKFRPILDSTVVCSFNQTSRVATRYYDPDAPRKYREEITGGISIFYIVEEMPVPEIQPQQIEKVLKERVYLNEQEKQESGVFWIQCLVNCKGRAGDFQIISCPVDYDNVCWQVADVIKEELSGWKPGKQRNHDIDILIKIKVTLAKGDFRVFTPVY